MKILLSIVIFVLTLSLAHRTLAEELNSAKLNSLFPKKQPDITKSVLPAKAQLTEPAYFTKVSGDKVTLKWQPAQGADSYHLQVATDPNFKWLKVDEQTLNATTYDLSQLEPGLHYFWRVQSITSNNEPTFRKSFFATSMFETAGTATEKK